MTESPTSSKLVKLKRALIGGLLSGGLAGISLFVLWFMHFTDPFLLFAWPYLYSGLLGFNSENPSTIIIAILIWFFLGAGLAYFVSSNKKVMRLWFLPFGLAFLLDFLLWFAINNWNGGM